MAQRLEDGQWGMIRTQPLSRSDFSNESPTWYRQLESLPGASDREQVISAVPAGRTYEVQVRGGATGRSPDKITKPVRRSYMAYMFEMRYQRWIESNDGCKIVERRTYGGVRMAKILSPVCVNPELDSPDALRLDDLDFPEPGAGIAAAPVRAVAEAMLEGGAQAVADCPASRAFLEQHLLSGKSVRLTYIDGVGVSSIEPLGWMLTKPVAAHLFREAILPPPLPTSDSLDSQWLGFTLLPAQFTAVLDPTRFLVNTHEIAVRTVPGQDESHPGYELSLLPWARTAEAMYADPAFRLFAAVPLGSLQYDPDRKMITGALFKWPWEALRGASDQLFFERDPDERPALTVHYRCRAD